MFGGKENKRKLREIFEGRRERGGRDEFETLDFLFLCFGFIMLVFVRFFLDFRVRFYILRGERWKRKSPGMM